MAAARSTVELAAPHQTREKRPRRGALAAEQVLETAGRLQMLGPLGVSFGFAEGGGQAAFAAELDRSFRLRCASAWDLPRIASALEWLGPFLLATGRDPLWMPAVELPGMVYNRITLDMLGEFIRTSPPLGKTKGEHVSADVAQSYVGVIRTLRSREARYDIAPEHVNINAPLAFKAMRREDGPKGQRRIGRGLRAEMLAAAAAAGFSRTGLQAAIDWAAALTAHNLMLRGGEVGVPDGIEPDPRRILTFASFEWREASDASGWVLWLIITVIPIKDPTARKKGYPCPIARRHSGPLGADAMCTYDALVIAYWLRRGGPLSALPRDAAGAPRAGWWRAATRRDGAAADDAPFFTVAGGFPYSTADTRRLVRSIVRAAGVPDDQVDEYGGKALRIGGATDWRAELGFEAARSVIKRRGRWESDVDQIYQRTLVDEQLRGSVVVGAARGASLEDVCREWVQPADR